MKQEVKPPSRIPIGTGALAAMEVDEDGLKQQLVRRIALSIQGLGWTQREAAECLGIDQPKVSALTSGSTAGFTVTRLFRFLMALGHDVDIVVQPRERGRTKRPGSMKVVSS